MEQNPFKNEQMDVVVEVATPNDMEAYRSARLESLWINPEAFGSTIEKVLAKDDEQWRIELSNEKKFYVLAKIGTDYHAVKSMAGAFEKDDKGTWHVVGVYTSPEFRGKGISQKVINKVLDEIKRRGGKKATLNVTQREEQEAARQLYKKFGFVEEGEEEQDGEFHIVMSKVLNEG